jgi:Nucleotidyltransferase of unknown function (DUF6036)
MSKTGGGRGTNQHKVKGRSVQPGSRVPSAVGARLTEHGPGLVGGPMDGAEIRKHLEDLAALLDETGVEARITLAGGAALTFYYDRQMTADVDAALYSSDDVLARARELAAKAGLREDWLNDAVVGFFPHEDVTGDVVIQRGGVSIEVASPEVLLAMKLRACRPVKDLFDLAYLLRRCDVRSTEEAAAWLDRYYPEEELTERHLATVRLALGAISLPTHPPTQLDAVEPRPAPTRCNRWVVTEDGRCVLRPAHSEQCSTGVGPK